MILSSAAPGWVVRGALGSDLRITPHVVAARVHLAGALAEAGAVQGVTFDMHRGMVCFCSRTPNPTGSAVVPTRLLPDMTRAADRYFAADQRDFFDLTTRASSGPCSG